MKALCFLFALLVLGTPVSADPPRIPPGLDRQGYTLLGVCDCLSVEMRQRVWDARGFLQENRNIRDAVMALWMNGALECTEPDPFQSTPGEAYFRAAIHVLDGIGSGEQEFCR